MIDPLITTLQRLGRPRLLVLGDVMLDRYIWGDAERVSQEAPVLTLAADRREDRLGGAAGVACMLRALEAQVLLAGIVGRDAAGARCGELLDDVGVDRSLILVDEDRPTTLKERYIGRAQHRHPQQILRVDYEVKRPMPAAIVERILKGAVDALERCDAVLVSDYDKGVCLPQLLQPLIQECRRRGKKIIVDPIRGGDYASRYLAATAMTPNRLEAGLAAGMSVRSIDDALVAAQALAQDLRLDAAIVTLDKEGMVLADANGNRRAFPVRRQRQVYDITGAGDMVLAMLGLALADGLDFPDAIELAGAAAGVVVERIGSVGVTRDELFADLCRSASPTADKMVDRDLLVRLLDQDRKAGRSIVFTNGCFDILHAGHIQYLAEARSQGDLLVLGLNTDASVRRLGKGADRPINDEQSRGAVLSALACVDYVCLFDEPTPLELIQAVRPDVLVKGADYTPENVVGREFVESLGGRLHLAPLVPGKSTTAILKKAREADPA